MKFVRILSMLMMISCVCLSNVSASENTKRTLKGDMTEVYSRVPEDAGSIDGMFSEGMFYGRVRLNSFLWDWRREEEGRTKDHWSVGVGGSMIFKSAYLGGIGLTTGLYTSQNPWHMDGEDYRFAKPGKETFSRYSVATGNGWGMTVLAQAYLEYRFANSGVRVGRQLFESLLTSSNDTKMIPNAFRGISFESGDVAGTLIRAAWFDGQKLRDHSSFHHVLAYGDDPDNPNACWTQNDDSAMHKGITLSKLREAGIEDRLIILQADNKTIENLTIMVNITDVPDLVGSVTGELNYSLDIGDGYKLVPGIRYLTQMDHGGGELGGASLKGMVDNLNPAGYTDPTSLESSMFAARISIGKGAWSVLTGYSKVSDDADLVAPWRGIPTGGYSRAMGQYNWYANTVSWMVQCGYDFEKTGIVSGLSVKARYVIQDYDDKKPYVPADSNVLNIDFLKKVASVPGLGLKLRTNFVLGDTHTVDMNGSTKMDPGYNEYRFEMNYLF